MAECCSGVIRSNGFDLSNNVVCPARFDEWLKGLCDPSPFSVTGNPDSDQQRIAQNVIQVYFFYVPDPILK